MMAAPEANDSGLQSRFEFLQVPDEQTIARDGGSSPFTTRHLLSLAQPLPAALTTYIRLDRLGDDELELYSKRAKKGGKELHEMVRADEPLDAISELLSLGALRGVLQAMVDGYPQALAEDETTLSRPTDADAPLGFRRWCAVALRASELHILHASLAAVDARLLPQLRALLADATAQERGCRATGQTWSTMQSRRGAVLGQATARIHRTFERLMACQLGPGETTATALAQACSSYFVLLAGKAWHPLAHHVSSFSEMSPLVAADSAPAEATATKAAAPEAVAGEAAAREAAAAQDRAPLPPLDLSMLHDGTTDGIVDMAAVPHAAHGTDAPMPLPLPYLALYKAKMSYWGAYLVSQWGVARALSVPETSLMLQVSCGGLSAQPITADHTTPASAPQPSTPVTPPATPPVTTADHPPPSLWSCRRARPFERSGLGACPRTPRLPPLPGVRP